MWLKFKQFKNNKELKVMNLEKANKLNKFNFYKKEKKINIREMFYDSSLIIVTVLYVFVSGYSVMNAKVSVTGEVSYAKYGTLANNSNYDLNETNSFYTPVLTNVLSITFDKNPEKLKKDVWDKFGVPAHFAYVRDNNAEIGFTYQQKNYTATINKDNKTNTLYDKDKRYLVMNINGKTNITAGDIGE